MSLWLIRNREARRAVVRMAHVPFARCILSLARTRQIAGLAKDAPIGLVPENFALAPA